MDNNLKLQFKNIKPNETFAVCGDAHLLIALKYIMWFGAGVVIVIP